MIQASDRTRLNIAGRAVIVWLILIAAEILHGSRVPPEQLGERLSFENEAVVHDALAAGRRVRLLAAHHCNWEWLLL